MTASIAVDMGGTFTDLIALDGDGQIRVAKSLTTPREPTAGIFDSIAKAQLKSSDISYFVHGTTVGTNMLIERGGPRIGLITTKGFRDVLRIQRIVRPESFDLHWVKPRHLVERALSLEVGERIGSHGEVVTELNEDEVRTAVATLKAADVKSVAISYLFSFLNPCHERRTPSAAASASPSAVPSPSTAASSVAPPPWSPPVSCGAGGGGAAAIADP